MVYVSSACISLANLPGTPQCLQIGSIPSGHDRQICIVSGENGRNIHSIQFMNQTDIYQDLTYQWLHQVVALMSQIRHSIEYWYFAFFIQFLKQWVQSN
jgi:queuine/archaeosine tRNA-ribosyltransferase